MWRSCGAVEEGSSGVVGAWPGARNVISPFIRLNPVRSRFFAFFSHLSPRGGERARVWRLEGVSDLEAGIARFFRFGLWREVHKRPQNDMGVLRP
jgi:hypothetical protein